MRGAFAAAMQRAGTRHGHKPPQITMELRLVVRTTARSVLDALLALPGRETTRERVAAAPGFGC